nr:hypothetical protein [Tanacetum cinerariifolium]
MNITEGTLNEIPSDSLDVEITDDATVVVEEELQEMNISQATLIDEMLPFDSELPPPDTLDVKLTDDAIEDVEQMLQDISINESALIDEFAPSNPLGVELTSDEAEETMEDSSTKAED